MKSTYILIMLAFLSCNNKIRQKNYPVLKNDTTTNKSEDGYFSYDDEYPKNTVIKYEDFTIEILNYQVQNEVNELEIKDTLALEEWIGSNLINRKINIKTPHKKLKFTIEYSFNDLIEEQYDNSRSKDFEKWERTKNRWEGFTPYQKIEELGKNEFKFPNIEWWDYCEKLRKKELNLKDTLVNLSGETDNIATLIYKGKPALHSVENIFIKITVIKKNKKSIKYLKIITSKGC